MDKPDYPLYRSDANDPVSDDEERPPVREQKSDLRHPVGHQSAPGRDATQRFIDAEKERVAESKTMDTSLEQGLDRP